MSLAYRSLETAEDILIRERTTLTDLTQKDTDSYRAVSSALEYIIEEHGSTHPLVEEFAQDLLGLECRERRNHYKLEKL